MEVREGATGGSTAENSHPVGTPGAFMQGDLFCFLLFAYLPPGCNIIQSALQVLFGVGSVCHPVWWPLAIPQWPVRVWTSNLLPED